MTNKDYWQMLKNLPHAVIKETGKSTGYYELCIKLFDGEYSLKYIMVPYPYDLEYPFSCTGNSLEEVVEKAFTFFEKNTGKYKIVKYETEKKKSKCTREDLSSSKRINQLL